MNVNEKSLIVVAGGGAAGFFAAIHIAKNQPEAHVILLEKSARVLGKVKVSGGGRCNVTHSCFEIRKLIQHYPRGGKALISPFIFFGPQDTINWFNEKGVTLKTEQDGRMFPETDDSETIIQALMEAANEAGVEIRFSAGLVSLQRVDEKWRIQLQDDETLLATALVLATGSSERIWNMLAELTIKINNPVPSLFTLHIPDKALHNLSGLSVEKVVMKLEGTKLQTEGPLLITHWGFSGPVTLKLSAWAARELYSSNYKGVVLVNWLPDLKQDLIVRVLMEARIDHSKKLPRNTNLFPEIPKRLWEYLLLRSGINDDFNWADLSNKQLNKLTQELSAGRYTVSGKSIFKEEFVTCGGVDINEINLKTMEAKRFPGLFFCGEVVDVDAVTGGFNFQWAWTSGYMAAQGVSA